MGFLRGAALVFVCILFIFSVFFTGVFSVLSLSLKYENVRPQIASIFDDLPLGGEEIDSLIEANYYKEYSCEFWKCFKEESIPLFLVSKYAKDYWKSKFYLSLFISLLFGGLIFLLMKKKINFFLLSGFLVIVSFIPISILDSIGKFMLKIVFSSVSSIDFNGFIDLNSFGIIFLSGANSVFFKGLTIGLVFISAGIFLKMLKFGFKIEHLIKFKFGSREREEEEIKTKKDKKGLSKRPR